MHDYQNIISLENLFLAWEEFVSGKKRNKDVREFSLRLSENIFKLHLDLSKKTYIHGNYEAFKISDPKPRDIHKATVRDRLFHHAIYRVLYPYFEKRFIYDSYSCRDLKGTHRAMNRFFHFYRMISRNSTKTCWVLKCDIKKFFATVDHERLLEIISRHDVDIDTQNLVKDVVESFSSNCINKGLPLGNLTSQLLVNVYMNEFDQYMKHKLKIKCYIRFADDFVVMSHDKKQLGDILKRANFFLQDRLLLYLHPKKVSIKTFSSGVDFLGWIHFPNHRVLRTSTKRRMLKNLKNDPKKATIASYKGMLKHGNTHKLWRNIENSTG